MKKLLALALICCGLAHAQVSMLLASQVAGGGGTYTGPLDIITTNNLAFWSLRAASSAKRGTKVATVCDAGDFNCADMLSDATTGNPVVPSSNPNCSTSACTVKTLYDQSGLTLCVTSAACDLTQATEANRPTLTVSCLGSLPCMTFGSTTSMVTPDLTSGQSQPFSASAVVERTGSFTNFNEVTSNVNGAGLGLVNSANTAYVYAGAVLTAAASDSAFHALASLFNSASSKLAVDGSVTNGDASTLTLSFGMCMGGCTGSHVTGKITEAGWWLADKSANFSALSTNQHTYWGF